VVLFFELVYLLQSKFLGGNMKTYAGKRLFDIFLAGIGFVLLLPVFIIIIFVIYFDSGFPIIYTQFRIGLYGKKFKLYKFRSMVVGAHEQRSVIIQKYNLGTNDFRFIADPRVTHVGKILRRWNLDELLQLINILRGDMTFVGPRPLEEHWCENNNYKIMINELRPGLTGYYQLYSHCTNRSDEFMRIKLVQKYWHEISFLTDLKIIFKTLKVVFYQEF